MTIQTIEEIKENLFLQKRQALNFSNAVNFPFSSLYLEIVTQIPIIEISAECVLLNSVVAWNDTREFKDPGYWSKNY
jgi:hypothetical protein